VKGYTRRHSSKGAYWEDRYHATAVETDWHLMIPRRNGDTPKPKGGVRGVIPGKIGL
jgi:hypothetical protein